MMTCDAESLDTFLRTVERTKDLRKQRVTLSSVSLTCFGGVQTYPLRQFRFCNITELSPTICFVTAFGKPICSCRASRGRSQGFAFPNPASPRWRSITLFL